MAVKAPSPDLDRYFDACNQVFKEARDALSISDVWHLAGYQHDPAPMRDGLYWSPFRQQGDKKTFSVFQNGKGYKDFARDEEKGDVVNFVQRCMPGAEFEEVAAVIVELAGMKYPPKPKQKDQQAPDPKQEEKLLRERRLNYQRRMKKLEERTAEEIRQAREFPRARAARHRWPDAVRDSWLEGRQWASEQSGIYEKLCKKRGWPVEWALALEDLGKISFPVLVWENPGWKRARHFVSFLVEAPDTEGQLMPIGYHQKFFDPRTERKGFVFVPYAPRTKARIKTELQKACVKWALEKSSGIYNDRGEWVAVDFQTGKPVPEAGRPALVPPLPFALGYEANPNNVDLVIIMEGQWDALSMWGALGYLDQDGNYPDLNTVVFGIRGAENWREFLSFYKHWIQGYQGKILLVPHPDRAGEQWLENYWDHSRVYRVCFMEMLRRAGCQVTALEGNAEIGDFNDWFALRKPRAADMLDLLQTYGVLEKQV